MTQKRIEKADKKQSYPRVPRTKEDWAPGLFEAMEREIDDYKKQRAADKNSL